MHLYFACTGSRPLQSPIPCYTISLANVGRTVITDQVKRDSSLSASTEPLESAYHGSLGEELLPPDDGKTDRTALRENANYKMSS